MRRHFFRRGPAAVLVAVSTLLTACQGGASAGNADGTMMINYASGKTVLQRNFNPLTLTGDATQGTRIYMYQSLMGVNVLKGGAYEPWLASGENISKDGRTLTVTIDKSATWSDGKPVTAADVVFTFGLVKKYPEINGGGTSFDSVTATGEKTVVFRFSKPAFTQVSGILQQYIVPQAHWKGKNPVTYANPDPVGSGAYTLKRFNPQQVTLALRKDYWRSKSIKVKTIQLPVVNSATEISQLEGGKEDLSGGAIANLKKLYVDKNPKLNGYFYPTYGSLLLYFNHDRPALKNVHVRKAVSLAIDKNQLIQLVTQLGASPISQTGLDATTQGTWLDPAYAKPITTDLTAAKSELEKAGYTLRGGKAVNSAGKQLSLTYIEVSDFADSVQRARIIADQLAKIGIKVTVQPLASGTFTDAQASGDFDLAAGGVAYGAVPWQIYNPLMNSKYAGTPHGKAQTNNFMRWRDPATDALLNQLAVSGNQQQQVSLTKQLEKIIVDQVPFVTLSNITAGCAWSARNWTGFPSAKDPYDICAPWNGGPAFENVLSRLKPTA